MVAVAGLSQALDDGIQAQARQLLAADLAVESPSRWAMARREASSMTAFGAFVDIGVHQDGLVHISELADFRVGKVEDVCKLGDQMWVKCIGIDDRGRIKPGLRADMVLVKGDPTKNILCTRNIVRIWREGIEVIR